MKRIKNLIYVLKNIAITVILSRTPQNGIWLIAADTISAVADLPFRWARKAISHAVLGFKTSHNPSDPNTKKKT